MNNIKVSIECLVYNHAPFLRDCFDGFVMQKTDFDFEVLVHDDASKDGSQEIIKEYTAKYPDLFFPVLQTENQWSKGVHIWTKYQMNRVRGKYIAVCEGDDFWTDPLKLQKQVDILEADPTLSCVVTNCSIVDRNSKVLQPVRERYVVKDNIEGRYNLHQFFSNGHQYPTLTAVYRFDICQQINDDYLKCRGKFLGDWMLWVLLHTKGDIYYLNQVTGAYRINPNSITHTQNEVARCKEDFTIRRNLKALIPKEYHKYINNSQYAWFNLAMAYKNHGKGKIRYLQMVWCLIRSFFCQPVFFVRRLKSAFRERKRG